MDRFVPGSEDNCACDKYRSGKHTVRGILAYFDPKQQSSSLD